MLIPKKIVFYILPLFLILQGCTSFLQQTGVARYYSDSNIQFHILQQLRSEPDLYQPNHIVTTVYHGNVLIVGQVLQSGQRIQVQQIVQGIPGVNQIYNQLQIAGPSSTLTRSSDAWITSKVKTDMLVSQNLASRNIKIVTEDGIVYLLGTVNSQQANQATNIASTVPGVQKVINFFVISQ